MPNGIVLVNVSLQRWVDDQSAIIEADLKDALRQLDYQPEAVKSIRLRGARIRTPKMEVIAPPSA